MGFFPFYCFPEGIEKKKKDKKTPSLPKATFSAEKAKTIFLPSKILASYTLPLTSWDDHALVLTRTSSLYASRACFKFSRLLILSFIFPFSYLYPHFPWYLSSLPYYCFHFSGSWMKILSLLYCFWTPKLIRN